jgi:serine protease AprX
LRVFLSRFFGGGGAFGNPRQRIVHSSSLTFHAMRFFLFLLIFFNVAALAAQSATLPTDKVSPEVRAAWQRNELPDVVVIFSEQTDVTPARHLRGKVAKSAWVFDALRATADRTQGRARQVLHAAQAHANSFYLVNAIAVADCPAELGRQLAALPEVAHLSNDPWVELAQPTQHLDFQNNTTERSAVEWGIEKINAPAVWNLGYTGQGITIGGADTGYDWVHPTLRPHYRGWNVTADTFEHNYNWFDAINEPSPLNGDANNPCGFGIGAPCDDQSHGTHTMGTMTGDDGQGNQIGVAPGAKWVGCRNMERGWGQPSTYIGCFQWFLAPTDTNGTNPQPAQAPHVINNSWYCAVSEGCTDLNINELMRQAVINLKAAGVFVVVSNGNFGGQGCASTYGPPAYFEESFSVGSTQQNDTISGFSSRGPVTIDGSNRIKPNVSAPGSSVRSSTPGGNFAWFSGTSMAGPHVAGLVALILSAQPDLIGEVEAVEDLIEATCVRFDGYTDCSDGGGLDYPNNTFGYGRVDALAAVLQATVSAPSLAGGPALEVRAYPNPASDVVFFELKNAVRDAQLTVFGADGRVVTNRSFDATQGQLLPVSLQNQPRGVYFWQIRVADGVRSGRVVLR